MMKNCVVNTTKKDILALCIAAYVLIADHFSPLSIISADKEETVIEERPFSPSRTDDLLITIMANLAMFVGLEPDTYTPTNLEQVPDELLEMIAILLRKRGKRADYNAVLRERDRLLSTVSNILRTNHMFHLGLAVALMYGPLDTEMIENLKAIYCNNDFIVA